MIAARSELLAGTLGNGANDRVKEIPTPEELLELSPQ
jgi:hypothetical protein